MYLLDVLANASAEEKAKLDEEEERKKKDQEKLTLPLMYVCKRKRSIRETKPAMAVERSNDQNSSDDANSPELDQAAEENNDHREEKEEEREKISRAQKKKKKISKVVVDDDYGVKQKPKKPKNNKNKKKVVDLGAFIPPPDLPMEIKNRIIMKAEANGGGVLGKEVLVIQKALRHADIEIQQNRFSIPVNQMLNGFLEPNEVALLETRKGKLCYTKVVGIIEPSGQVEKVNLSRWEMKKEKGKSSISYVLKGDWKEVVSNNNLEEDDIVQLWAVRIGPESELFLVFVILSRKEEEEGRIINGGIGDSSNISSVGGGDQQGDGASTSNNGDHQGDGASTSGVDKSEDPDTFE